MANKLEKLTKAQEQKMREIRQKWLDKMFKNFRPVDRKKAKEFVKFIYELAGLKEPKMLFVDSPLAAQYSANMLKRDQVGDQVWAQVRDQVGAQVRDQVGAQVWAQVWDQVEAQVRDQVGDQVGAQVRDQVGAQVRDQVWDQVRDQVRAQVRDQVQAQVRAQVGDQEMELFSFSYYGSVSDYGWLSFHDFFTEIGILGHENFEKFIGGFDSNLYDMLQFKELCIVCNKPVYIKRDQNNKLHCENGSAIKWADGYELFYIHGVSFGKELYNKVTTDITFKEIMSIDNMEQRMAALKLEQNRTKLMEVEGAKVIHKSDRGNELWLVPNLFSQGAYFLRYECPSTGRIYVSGIDPEVGKKGNADECMAWKFNLELDTYKVELTVEK